MDDPDRQLKVVTRAARRSAKRLGPAVKQLGKTADQHIDACARLVRALRHDRTEPFSRSHPGLKPPMD